MTMNNNPYQPMPMRIARMTMETDDQSLMSFELEFERQEDQEHFFSQYRPGQFCQLSVFGKGEAPFGVASAAWEGNFVRFTVNKVGTLTRTMHAMRPGDPIGMRGPLGNGFPLEAWEGMNLVVVGGGCAFTTLYALVNHVLHPDVRPKYGELMMIYGARTPGLFMYKADIESWYDRRDIKFCQAIDVHQEGWCHYTGYVPDVTKEIAPSEENAVAIVCGPPIMNRFTFPVLSDLGFSPDRIYLSLEKRMKCGIGKCGRCNIGHEYICKDGPVFTLAQLQQLPNDL